MEKSKVIFFDRRPEANKRPPTSASSFPNTLLGGQKNSFKNIKRASFKKYNTYKKNNKNQAYINFTRTSRRPPIEAKNATFKIIKMFPNDEKELHYNEENKCLNKQKKELKEIYENMLIKLNEPDKLRDEEI